MRKQSKCASTIIDGTARVYYFHTDTNAREVLSKKTKSLFDWQMPNLPEDLSFFRKGEVWLSTSSHEEECHVYPTNKEEFIRVMNIQGIKAVERQD